MSSQPSSPQHSQDQPQTPPSRDKPTTATTTTRTPRPGHTRKTSQPTFSTPKPSHRRHLSRSQSQTQQTNTPLPLHHQNQPSNLDLGFPLSYDSPTHFSPSKARAAAQASHQLAVLQRWLGGLLADSSNTKTNVDTDQPSPTDASSSTQSAILSKWVTQHQTLTTTNPELASQSIQWLEAVMAANQLSDERRRLVFEAKKAELARFEQSEKQRTAQARDFVDGDVEDKDNVPSTTATDLLEAIISNLTPSAESSLTSLSNTSILLGQSLSFTDATLLSTVLTQGVIDYTIRSQDLQAEIDGLQALQRKLERELEETKMQLAKFKEMKKVADKEEEDVLIPQTARWNREIKQIAMKIQEYKDRVAVLERNRPGSESGLSHVERFVRVEDVVEIQDRVKERRSVVKKLEENVKQLSGLPPDLEASREEVKRARSELDKLKARREELFGILAGK